MQGRTFIEYVLQKRRGKLGVHYCAGVRDVLESGLSFNYDYGAFLPGRKVFHGGNYGVHVLGDLLLLQRELPGELASAQIFQTSSELRLEHDHQRDYSHVEYSGEDPVDYVQIEYLGEEGRDDDHDKTLRELFRAGAADEAEKLVDQKADYGDVDYIGDAEA